MPGILIEHVMLKYLINHKSGGRGPLDPPLNLPLVFHSKNVDTFPNSVRSKWRENDHFFYIRLALSICIGSSALDLQDPLSKFQTSVFLVKILHILPRVVQRHNNNKQIKASTTYSNKFRSLLKLDQQSVIEVGVERW